VSTAAASGNRGISRGSELVARGDALPGVLNKGRCEAAVVVDCPWPWAAVVGLGAIGSTIGASWGTEGDADESEARAAARFGTGVTILAAHWASHTTVA